MNYVSWHKDQLFQIVPFIRTYPAQRQKLDNQYQLQMLEHMPQQCATQTRKVFLSDDIRTKTGALSRSPVETDFCQFLLTDAKLIILCFIIKLCRVTLFSLFYIV